MTNVIVLLTNLWIATATITPHYTGESNFNSTTIHIEKAVWFQHEVYELTTLSGEKIEVVKTNKVVINLANTPISTREPFWYEGHLYRFVPTNMPATLTPLIVLPLRYRDEIVRPPQPPLPSNMLR